MMLESLMELILEVLGDVFLVLIESLLELILELLTKVLLLFTFWLLVLAISTPFVITRALVMALFRKQRFPYAVSDGYSSVSGFCKNWVH